MPFKYNARMKISISVLPGSLTKLPPLQIRFFPKCHIPDMISGMLSQNLQEINRRNFKRLVRNKRRFTAPVRLGNTKEIRRANLLNLGLVGRGIMGSCGFAIFCFALNFRRPFGRWGLGVSARLSDAPV